MEYPVYIHPAFVPGEPFVVDGPDGLLRAISIGIEKSPIGEVLVSQKKTVFQENRSARRPAGAG